jgi:ABC-2 type transport system permease protein
MNSMGATLYDVLTEYRILWIQAGAYFLLAVVVYRYQILRARRYAKERLMFLKHNREARMKDVADS